MSVDRYPCRAPHSAERVTRCFNYLWGVFLLKRQRHSFSHASLHEWGESLFLCHFYRALAAGLAALNTPRMLGKCCLTSLPDAMDALTVTPYPTHCELLKGTKQLDVNSYKGGPGHTGTHSCPAASFPCHFVPKCSCDKGLSG